MKMLKFNKETIYKGMNKLRRGKKGQRSTLNLRGKKARARSHGWIPKSQNNIWQERSMNRDLWRETWPLLTHTLTLLCPRHSRQCEHNQKSEDKKDFWYICKSHLPGIQINVDNSRGKIWGQMETIQHTWQESIRVKVSLVSWEKQFIW